MLNVHFPSPISINEAEIETAAGALGHSASGGECASKHLTFALAEHPTAPVMSPGQLVLGDGQREKWCLPQSLTSRRMVGKAYKTSGTDGHTKVGEKKIMFGTGKHRNQRKISLSTHKYHEGAEGWGWRGEVAWIKNQNKIYVLFMAVLAADQCWPDD